MHPLSAVNSHLRFSARFRALPSPLTGSRAPGTSVEFQVTRVQSTPKAAFPACGVYGATADPELRVITCGGTFDPGTGHYLCSTIIYAAEVTRPTAATPPPPGNIY